MAEPLLSPYLHWAKTRQPAAIDLAGSNLLHCDLDDLPGARDAVELAARNDEGFIPLREAIAAHYGVTPNRVVTGTGCAGATFLAIGAIARAGDDVLVERPAYDPLMGACRLLGINVRRFDRRADEGYAVDPDAVRAQLTPRTRAVILTSPHNPSGVGLDADRLEAVGREAARVGAVIIVDEVYLDGANACGDARRPLIPAARLDGPFISTSSLTKSYGLAGLRCGWAIAPPEIAERIQRTRDVVDNVCSVPSERLGALAFQQLAALTARTRRILGGNLERAREFFASRAKLVLPGPPSSSIVFARLDDASKTRGFVQRLLDGYGVAVAPGHFFESPDHFRVSVAGDPEVLAEGLRRLGAALDAE
ncbi:MAG TPA: pyridoxal phosphate-dependent aminotransferase [Vicinamibacterales bacterium]|nr:pyridoxal phosphate-dependent aminotransferase [Vicinamibacterales bacterium]